MSPAATAASGRRRLPGESAASSIARERAGDRGCVARQRAGQRLLDRRARFGREPAEGALHAEGIQAPQPLKLATASASFS